MSRFSHLFSLLTHGSWFDHSIKPGGIANPRVEKTTEIFSHTWDSFIGGPSGSSSRGTTLPAGNYEWPFELIIPGSMAESVEGLRESHIVYKLKATAARGKLAKDHHDYRAVRIVRTLDAAALELAHAMTVENVWPNKIQYQIAIPQKAVPFGTAIDVEMKFTSLLKGLRIGTIKCNLIEVQDFSVPGINQYTERYHRYQRDIAQWTFEVDEAKHYQQIIDEETGQDGYIMNERMPIPKNLSKCLQDVDVQGIKIRHKLKFNISLHNPDGHVSEVSRVTCPIILF